MNKVTLAEGIIQQFQEQARRAMPIEQHAFLLGRVIRPSEYRVEQLHICSTDSNGHNYFRFTNFQHSNAWKSALQSSQVVLGLAHSHPYGTPPNTYGTTMSHKDAKIQIENHFPLMLVLALFDKSFALDIWLNGYAAPLDVVQVIKGRSIKVPGLLKYDK